MGRKNSPDQQLSASVGGEGDTGLNDRSYIGLSTAIGLAVDSRREPALPTGAEL
jgi:hypothetical protein